MVRTVAFFALAIGWASCGTAKEIDFNLDIRPILSDNCFLCHGPSESTRKAELRLDNRDAAVDSGALVPGDPQNSELLARVITDDSELVMPPPETNKKITPEQRELLQEWIKQGAEYEQHWAFVTPRKAEAKISENPIDHFIGKRLATTPLSFSEEADPRILIRRVTFDLTGLPPTIDEVDQYLKDVKQSSVEEAYEKVVDRLLSSHAYGERMALPWLDAARYGDTSVMHADGPRDMWPWRDWVINAYNSNMPFNQFTVEQLAGDLIPDATPQQKLASGFNRNHATSDEGGAFAEELRVEYVVDRVSTTSKVWLGLTMECAQCHDHKYDPISQEEYYRFFAYFNNTADPGMQTRRGNQTPVVELKSEMIADAYREEREARLNGLKQKVSMLEEELNQYSLGTVEQFQKWAIAESEKYQAGNAATEPLSGLIHWFPMNDAADKSFQNGLTGSAATLERGKLQLADRAGGKALVLDGKTEFVSTDETTQLVTDQPFTFAAWLKHDGKSGGTVFARMDVANGYRGYDMTIQGTSVGTHIINTWPNDAIKVVSKDQLKANEWQHVVITYDGSQKASGVKIYIDGKLSDNKVEADALKSTIETSVPFKIGSRSSGANWKGEVDDIRIYDRAIQANEVPRAMGDVIEEILAINPEGRSDQQTKTLEKYYLANFDENYQKKRKSTDQAIKELNDFESTQLTSMIMTDNPVDRMRKTFILDRGQYDSPRKDAEVSVGVPAALPKLSDDAPQNRLGLAYWLTDPQHPLTSRVAINRYWTMFFGNGIVRTVSDFGSQGSPPSHPELLDWLAVDFVESGWDVKRMIKTIVMSQTYRQSSRRAAEHSEIDPENLLLARSPRFRLQGEFIRDTSLVLGGLLVDEVGGPGVKPYQPPNIWNEVSLNGGLRYQRDSGDKLYRKSLYTYWKRSAPMPNMLIFDAPTREKCVVKRARTNTPLQALVTLNDPQFVEASRAFAQELLQKKSNTRDRIDLAYQMAVSRKATEREVEILSRILEQETNRFDSNPEDTKKFLTVGEWKRDESIDASEHAAWTVVTQMILNLDETLTRG